MNRKATRRLLQANLLTALVILCVAVATLVLVIVYGAGVK